MEYGVVAGLSGLIALALWRLSLYLVVLYDLSSPERRGRLLLFVFIAAVVYVELMFCNSWQEGLLSILFSYILAMGAIIDMRQYILPDVGALFLFLGGLLHLSEQGIFFSPLLQAGGMGLCMYALRMVSRKGLGLGDVKWMTTISLWLSFETTVLMVCSSFLLGACYCLGLLLFKGRRTTAILPFGPFICMASCLAYFGGEPIIQWYLQL